MSATAEKRACAEQRLSNSFKKIETLIGMSAGKNDDEELWRANRIMSRRKSRKWFDKARPQSPKRSDQDHAAKQK